MNNNNHTLNLRLELPTGTMMAPFIRDHLNNIVAGRDNKYFTRAEINELVETNFDISISAMREIYDDGVTKFYRNVNGVITKWSKYGFIRSLNDGNAGWKLLTLIPNDAPFLKYA